MSRAREPRKQPTAGGVRSRQLTAANPLAASWCPRSSAATATTRFSVAQASARGAKVMEGNAAHALFASQACRDKREQDISRETKRSAVIALLCADGRRTPSKLTHPQRRKAGKPTMKSKPASKVSAHSNDTSCTPFFSRVTRSCTSREELPTAAPPAFISRGMSRLRAPAAISTSASAGRTKLWLVPVSRSAMASVNVAPAERCSTESAVSS